jgi:hypothetical protein
MQLSLSLQDPANIARALAMPPQGATLEINFHKEEALALFFGVRKVIQTMGWLPPKEDESQS